MNLNNLVKLDIDIEEFSLLSKVSLLSTIDTNVDKVVVQFTGIDLNGNIIERESIVE